ncbi:MAG: hypothetical protein ACXAC2_18635 [Candidatus Kariarchaeaceae archaeon]
MFTIHTGLSFQSTLLLHPARVEKAVRMLQRDRLSLFGHMTNDTIYGVVKSQTNPDLSYSCWLRADGSYACHTNNLNTCGGLRNALCKHIIVVLRQFSFYNEIHEILRELKTYSVTQIHYIHKG